jgi:hypothetical protein
VSVVRGLETGMFAYIMFGIIIIRHIPNLREMVRSRSAPSLS